MYAQKRSQITSLFFLAFFLLGLLTACSLKPRSAYAVPVIATATLPPADPPSPAPTDTALPPSPTPSPSPTQPPTATTTPTATASSTPTLTPTMPPTLPVPVAEGRLIGGGVNLREGPSHLFPVLQALPYNAPVSIFGAAPGRQWLQVKTQDGITGWIAAQYVQVDLAMESISIATPSSDWITLKGSVKDSAGQPIVGAYIQLSDSVGHLTFTRSWEDSYFYLFLPLGSQGRWTLQAWRPACVSAFANNPSCPGWGFFLDNPRSLELSAGLTVDFVYKLYQP